MENLKKLRQEKGWTQKDFAKQCNIASSTYNQYETGKRQPDLETLKIIANKLETTIDYLLGNTKQKEKLTQKDEPLKITPEKKILLNCFDKANEDDQRVIWTVLDKYMTPNEKEYFSQSDQANNVG